MADWTHAICRRCWKRREPERMPMCIVNPEEETCCFCGKKTNDGIYVRESPLRVKRWCRGHDDD